MVLGVLRGSPIVSSDGLVMSGMGVMGVSQKPSMTIGRWSLTK